MIRVKARTVNEELQAELAANPISASESIERQEELLLSRVRVALQDGGYTPETQKYLMRNFVGAVHVQLSSKPIQDLPLTTLFAALKVISTEAGISTNALSVAKRPGGFLRSDTLVATFPSEDAANRVKTYVTNPSLLERALA